MSVISGEFEDATMISGVRLLDKSSLGREGVFRLEIWTVYNDKATDCVDKLRKHLAEEYVRLMVDDKGTHYVGKSNNTENPIDWLSKFSNHGNDSDSRPTPGQKSNPPSQK